MDKDFEKKEALLEASLEEFSIQRYDDASLNNILKKSAMSKGSFYYHFKNKKNLYLFLLEEVKNKKFEYIKKFIKEKDINIMELGFFESLRLQAEAGMLFAKDYPTYSKFGVKIIKEDSKNIIEEINKYTETSYKNFLEPMVQKAINNKEIRESFSTDFVVKMLSTIFYNYAASSFNEYENIDLDLALKDYQQFINFIEYGLKRR